MSEFYKLDTVLAADHRFFAGGQWTNDSRSRCRNCGMFDELSEPSTIEIALNHLGRRGFVEQLWNSHSLHVFRHDLIDLWRSNGLTGFQVKPVSIVGWFPKSKQALPSQIPSYLRLVTTSKVRLVQPVPRSSPCTVCGFTEYAFPKTGVHMSNGIVVDMTSWDGADIFGVRNYEFVFCSRRAAEVTLKAGYNRHVTFVRLENWGRWDEFDIHKWEAKAYKEYVEGFLIRQPEDL